MPAPTSSIKMRVFEVIQITITFQHPVNLIQDIIAKGFENSHTKFGVLLSMHVWDMTVSNLGGGADFFQ